MAESNKRARRTGCFRDRPFNPKKKWDLRQKEEFKLFRAHRYTFALHGTAEKDITIHTDTAAKELEDRSNVVKVLLQESFREVHEEGVPLTSYVHVYLRCDGFQHDFIWNGVGSKALTLGELLYTEEAMDEIIDKFTQVIQSNSHVILDSKTVLQVMVFEPPPQYQKPPRFPYVVYK